MNRYGHQAMALWAQWAPEAFAKIDNPQEFFTTLGEDAQEQMTEYLNAFLQESKDPHETNTLTMWAHHSTAKSMAEAQVRSEMLMPPTIEVGDDAPASEVMLTDLMPNLEPMDVTLEKDHLVSQIEDLYAAMDKDSPVTKDLSEYSVMDLDKILDQAKIEEERFWSQRQNRVI